MKIVFKKSKILTDVPFHYCAGCGHSIIHRLIAEVVEEMDLRDKIIGIAPVGCAVLAYDYWDFDVTEAAHGRPPAVATGIKRVHPDKLVFTYQGDGDLASIGMAEIVHAAARGEKISVIFVNNTVYGMTGGQMAPTTILNQKTTTTPYGRNKEREGYPIRMCELLASLDGAVYLERTTVADPAGILKTKKAIKKSFETQLEGKGFSMVEILSQCPVNWHLKPVDAVKYVKEVLTKIYPVGVIKG